MDRKIKKSRKYQRLAIGISGIVIFIFCIFYLSNLDLKTSKVDRSRFIVSEVEESELNVRVISNGQLLPIDIEYLDSKVEGVVSKIFVKPGSTVSKGDVLVQLSNNKLVNLVRESQMELAKAEAEKVKMEAEIELRVLNQRSELLDIELQYEMALLNLNAETTLIKTNNATVSKLQYEGTKLLIKQLESHQKLEQEKYSQLQNSISSQLQVEKVNLEILKQLADTARENLDFLAIKSNMDGVVQQIPLQVGQFLEPGSEIARIATQSNLYSELKVEDLQVSKVKLNQSVIIDTLQGTINGFVSRIDPKVESGYVTIDVELNSELPSSAKPDLRVTGTILISSIPNTLVVDRPYMAKANTEGFIFKLDASGRYATRQLVEYGESSFDKIQILSGLRQGDRIIVSDDSSLKKNISRVKYVK